MVDPAAMLGHEIRGRFGIDWTATRGAASDALSKLGLGHLDGGVHGGLVDGRGGSSMRLNFSGVDVNDIVDEAAKARLAAVVDAEGRVTLRPVAGVVARIVARVAFRTLSDTVHVHVIPDAVVIEVEMIHEARVVRLNAKHRTDGLRPWMGDSVGWYDGDTLVVETTNIPERQHFYGSWKNLKVTEWFKRTGPDKIHYRFQVEDPDTWEQPWGGEYAFTPAGRIYEYACHEGNYALPGILGGARQEEKAVTPFPHKWAVMFLVSVGFWNFLGAGIFGFLINLPIGALAATIVVTRLRLPYRRVRHAIDWWGSALLTSGLALFVVLATLGGHQIPWASVPAVAALAALGALAALFLRQERRAAEPVLPLRLFRNRILRVAAGVNFTSGLLLWCGIFFVPQFVQQVAGVSPTRSGLVLMPLMFGAAFGTLVAAM